MVNFPKPTTFVKYGYDKVTGGIDKVWDKYVELTPYAPPTIILTGGDSLDEGPIDLPDAGDVIDVGQGLLVAGGLVIAYMLLK